jgi:large subunit ribosomal protein L9
MDVILLEKVDKLGSVGERVAVKPGYARNFLIPKGHAVMATPENMAAVEARRTELEQAAAAALSAAQQRAQILEGVAVTLRSKAGTEGRLFGSIGTADIATALSESTATEVTRQEVRLPGGSLRQVGEYDVTVHLHSDVNVTVKVIITAET